MELVREEEIVDLLFALEVQAMPVDDGVAPEDQTYGLEVRERELVEGFELVCDFLFAQARSKV
jgi:hypothetical protein